MPVSSFKIGNVTLQSPFVLAPLAGITDKTMRSLCIEQGASFVYTEMVSAKGLWYGDRKSRKLLEAASGEEGRLGFQLFGCDPEIMAFAAKTLRNEPNSILDINAGCPVPKIVKNGEGSALLKDIDLLYDVIRAMVREAGKPVTAKIRMGFTRETNVAVEAARAIEAAGGAAVTVHGRTREQYYEGDADWEVISAVKAAVKIPVIGNGDVRCAQDAVDMLRRTGCDGVMIARGALGNPWIFRQANMLLLEGEYVPPPSDRERIEMLIRHLDMIAADKGKQIAVREIRKHVGWYIRGMRGAAALRRTTNTITDVNDMKDAILSMI